MSSAPPAASVRIGPAGLHASSQIETPTFTPAMLNSGQRLVRRDEVALLVEHRVVRQQLFAVDAVARGRSRTRPPRCAGRGPAPGNPITAAARAGACRDLVERLRGLRDERGPQEEILGRVPGDGELGEHDEIATRGLGFVVGLEDARRVAFEIADDDVQLGGGHPDARHRPRIRGAAPVRDTRRHDPMGG